MADYTDIDKLRELAEAATPGPWKWSVSVDRQWALVETAEDNLRILAQLPDDDDAAFIAAASPDVILALVAELVGLRTEVDQLRGERRRCNAIGHPTVTPESLIPCQLDRLLAMHPSDRTLYALKCAFEDEQRASQKEEQR